MGRAVFSKPDSHFVVTVHASPGSLVEACLIGEDEHSARLALRPSEARALAANVEAAVSWAKRGELTEMILPKVKVAAVRSSQGDVLVRAEVLSSESDEPVTRTWPPAAAAEIASAFAKAADFSAGLEEDDEHEPGYYDP